MTTGSFADMNCPIAQTLERVGERWTLLILRNAFCGMSRFDQFQQHLGIGSNILSNRLRSLTAEGILTRSPAPDDGRAFEYRLTEKGAALFPILIAMTEWGERFAAHPLGARLTLVERANGVPISGIRVLAFDGRALQAHDIAAAAGPAADEKTHALSAYSLAAAPSSQSKQP
ncbi:MAG: helix-turn-helix domain-containing protein [Pseudomonadota bacterium]